MVNWFNLSLSKLYSYGNKPITNKNYITMRKIIFPPAVGSIQFGIAHIIDWNPQINNNNITGYGYSGIDSVSAGILCMEDIGYPNNQEVMCNYIDTIGNGIYYLGGSYLGPGQGFNTFQNNEMRSCGKGFGLDDTYIGPTDNVWTGTYSNAGQYTTYTRNGAFPDSSWLYTQPGSPGDPSVVGVCWADVPSLTTVYSAGYGIANSGTNNSVTCNTVSSIGAYSGTNNKSLRHTIDTTAIVIHKLELMAEDSVKYSYFETEQHIGDRFKVYQMLCLQPSLKDNSPIQQRFYNTASSGTVGAIAKAAIALSTGQLQNATAALNAIVPQNTIEVNYKNYYSVYLHYRMKTYSQSDSVTLKTLAMGCPVRDGLIVHHARILYSKIYRDFTNYPNDCIDANSKSKTKQNKKPMVSNGLSLFPNPTTGSFMINIIGETTNNVEVDISDIMGKLISSEKIILNANTAIIDKGLPDGVYIISVRDANGLIGNPKKITVIH